MAGDEIDRGRGFPSARAVKIGRSHDALDHFADRIVIAAQETAGRVAVFAVPLHPPAVARKVADLIKPAGIPSFGNKFAVGQDRVMRDGFEQRRIRQGMTLRIAAENRCQIEAEAVDVVFGRPVTKAVEDEIPDHGLVAIERVAATAEVQVIAVGGEQIVGFVVESAERNDRSGRITFRGVVEDDIENDLDARSVEALDQIFEFVDLLPLIAACGEARFRCAEGQRAVTPVIAERFAGVGVLAKILVLVELEDRHEFHAIDPQLDQVGNFLPQPVVCPGMSHAGRCVPCETAHMHFVDDEVGDRKVERAIVPPVEVIFRYASAVREDVGFARRTAKNRATADGAGKGIKENVAAVEAVAGMRVERTVHAVAVFDFVRIEIEDHHGKDIAHAEFRRKRNLREGTLLALLEENQGARRGVGREDREIDSTGDETRAEGQGMTVAETENAVVVRGMLPAFRGAIIPAALRGGYFHLMLQPMLGCCGDGA